jgi:glycosyltransferase involved in cell wall biosynthesis
MTWRSDRGIPASQVAVLIPAWNEEPVIGEMLRRIPAGLFALVVVIDNGSNDRTAAVAAEHGAMVVLQPERGYGAACLQGIAALPAHIDAVAFLQADASEVAAEAEALLVPLREGRADMVIGSRVLGARKGMLRDGALSPHQRFGNLLAVTLMWLLYGHRYSDLGPFRIIRRDALDRLRMQDRNFGWTVEMQARALEEGLRVEELPVSYYPRVAGVGKVSASLKASLQAGYIIISTIFRLRWRSGWRGVNPAAAAQR